MPNSTIKIYSNKSAPKKIATFELLQEIPFTMAMICMIVWQAAFLYQATILNPMLEELYGMVPEKSSLVYTLGGVAFIITTPLAF
jgi:predicted MFS family arabinose efflux permease